LFSNLNCFVIQQIAEKLASTAIIASGTESAKKARETFRSQMSQHVVQCLSAYRKPDCKVGRIISTEDFKYLARKVFWFVQSLLKSFLKPLVNFSSTFP